MNPRLSDHQTRFLRLKAQQLLASGAEPPASPARILKEVLGVQAQDLPAALLAVRARSTGLTAARVEQARQGERAIVWAWCMRGTLHLIAAEDAAWLIPLLGPAFIAADRRRFRQLGWDEARAAAGMRLLRETLARRGELMRPEIVHLLERNGLPFEGQAPVHLLYRAALEGILCAGPQRGKDPAYVLFETWIGQLQPLPRQEALAKLAYRYLEAYGPARPEDLASWSGLKLGEAREAWQLIADRLIQVEVAGQAAWLPKPRLPWLDEPFDTTAVRLLPRFDTYLLGYANRDLVVDPAYARRIHPGGGQISPVLLVNGRAAGTWKTRRRRAHLEVMIEPFESLAAELLPLIEAEAADLGHFLGQEAVLFLGNPLRN